MRYLILYVLLAAPIAGGLLVALLVHGRAYASKQRRFVGITIVVLFVALPISDLIGVGTTVFGVSAMLAWGVGFYLVLRPFHTLRPFDHDKDTNTD